jgi:uncharacterized protein (DUF58 family)
MLSKEVLKKIRNIEVHTRRLLSGSLVGDNSSAQKGSGFEFDQIREYQQGDDVRFIDWNSSARMNKLLVRQYIEERSRTVLLVVDGSSSQAFSSSNQLKYDTVAQVASVLALVAEYGKDFVSVIFFTDQVEWVVPAGRGRKHVLTIMRKLFEHDHTKTTTTDINKGLEECLRHKRKDAVAFIISDFISSDSYAKALKIVGSAYDTVAIRCLDTNEQQLPNVGFIEVVDPETGERMLLDTRSKTDINSFLTARAQEQKDTIKRASIDLLDISPHKEFMADVVKFFRRRMRY